jgi:hypothetical protein
MINGVENQDLQKQYSLWDHVVGSTCYTMVNKTRMVAWVNDTHRWKFTDRRGRGP